MTTTWN